MSDEPFKKWEDIVEEKDKRIAELEEALEKLLNPQRINRHDALPPSSFKGDDIGGYRFKEPEGGADAKKTVDDMVGMESDMNNIQGLGRRG